MDDTQNRTHQMFARVKDFGMAHTNDFGQDSIGRRFFNDLSGLVTQLDNHAAAEASGRGKAREGTTNRAAAREALRDALEAINRTARSIAEDIPGIDDKFRLPRGNNDQNLLAAARAFAADATPISAHFVARELPENFIADLNSDIATFEAAISYQASGVGDHVAAGAAIDEAIEEGITIVRKLDALVRNKYADDQATLAEWTSASHTERSPRRRTPAAPPPTAPGTTPSPPGSTPPAPPAG